MSEDIKIIVDVGPQGPAGAAASVATDSIWDAKGDLAGGTGANTAARLPVGTNGQVLTADSAEATGLKWSNAGSGSGDVVGPASATDNAVARFDSTTGKLLQNSVVTIADSTGNVAGVGTLNTHTIPGGTGTIALTSDITGTNSGTNTGDQTITLTGDVTGSGTGAFAATIANDAVTYAKMQNVSATDKLLGRSTSGSGDVEEIACTAAGRALLDDADASAQRTTLGLGTLATQSGTFSGTSSGTNTGDQSLFSTIAVSGQSNVVADSTSDTLTLVAGSNITITTDASTDSITISSSGGGGGSIATDTLWDAKGDLAGGTGSNTAARLAVGTNGQVLTADSAEATGLKWTTVSGTGDVVGPASSTDNAIVRFDSTTGKLIQNSAVTIADTSGNIAGAGTISSAEITSSSLTASRALVSGASKEIQSSSVTATELGYVSGVTSAIQTQLTAGKASAIVCTFDGMGSAITATSKVYLEIPFAFTITGWSLFADTSGSIVIDVWKDTYANYPPTVADTIAGSEKPTLSSAAKNQDLTLTTWTTAVSAGDTLVFNVDSATTVTKATLVIRGTK